MAVLPDGERVNIWRALQNRWSETRDPCAFTKTELRAAVDALDDYMEANATAVNNALPAAFRTSATQAQKALVLAYVVLKRYGDPVKGE